MLEEIKDELPETFAPIDVIRKIQQKRPHVKANTIRCHVYAATPNHPSHKHYSAACIPLFYYLENGRFRRLRADESPNTTKKTREEAKTQLESDGDEVTTFRYSFEADLEAHLADCIESLEPGLSLLERQYYTQAGPIDLLAKDAEGTFVVIEIKAGSTGDRTIGQIMRYMGAIQQELSKGQPVRGIIVCETATSNLKYAASTIDRIQIKEYEVTFTFSDADLGE